VLLANYGNPQLSNKVLLGRLFSQKISFGKKFDAPNRFYVGYTVF
jgi:hypothetical protein